MSDKPTTPAAGSSADPVAATAPDIKTATQADLIGMTEGLDPSKLDELLALEGAKSKEAYAGTVPETATNPFVATPVVEPAAPVVTPAAPVAPEAVKPTDEEPAPEKLGKFRVQAKDFKEAELLRHMKTMSAEDAFKKVYGTQTPAAVTATPASDTPAVAPATDDATSALRDEIATLIEQSDKAAEDMEVKQANALNRQIIAKQDELRQIEAFAKIAKEAKLSEAQTNFQQRATESAKEVYAARPALADKASPERVEFDSFVGLKYGDPDYEAIFQSPRWPSVIYREFAEVKGWNKAAAPAPTPTLPVTTPGASTAPRVTAATVLVPGETPGGAPVNAAQLMKDIGNLSIAQIDEIMSKVA